MSKYDFIETVARGPVTARRRVIPPGGPREALTVEGCPAFDAVMADVNAREPELRAGASSPPRSPG